MKRFYRSFLMMAAVAMAFASCSNDSDPDEGNVEIDPVADLSAAEMANCYIVSSPGSYKFKADNQFNLGEGLPVPPEIHPEEATLLWQTVPGSISSVELIRLNELPYIQFEVEKTGGNALIAVTDGEGNIQWSWHIWMPAEEIKSISTATGYEVMTMNLGALCNTPGDPTSYGMLYQWGRKDPFPAAGTLTGTTTTLSAPMYDIDNKPVVLANSSWTSSEENTMEYSISHPMTVLSNYSQFTTSRDWLAAGTSDDSLWGNPNGYDSSGDVKFPDKGRKTCYDPSPAGWRVAPPDAFNHFTSTGGYAWDFADFNIADINKDGVVDINDYNFGWNFMVNYKESLYFPAAARFDGSYAMLMGSMSGLWGSYWSNAPYTSMAGGAFCALSFQVKSQNGSDMVTVSPSGGASRADAYSVRCVRDLR